MGIDWPIKKDFIKLGIIGMTEGNGHPYSWSAIFNGYDAIEMRRTQYPNITVYLDKKSQKEFGIGNAKVTHVYCNDIEDARSVSLCSKVENICNCPEDMIEEVDAVIIATDVGCEHLKLSRLFFENNVPVFIDKPLTDNVSDLMSFVELKRQGAKFMSSSSMRYARELEDLDFSAMGEVRHISAFSPKKWETYGIHNLEGIYKLLGPGFLSVRNVGVDDRNIVYLRHQNGSDASIIMIPDIYNAFGLMNIVGNRDNVSIQVVDFFYMFKRQLEQFISYLRTGIDPYPFSETVELMKLVIGGEISKAQDGREVYINEINK